MGVPAETLRGVVITAKVLRWFTQVGVRLPDLQSPSLTQAITAHKKVITGNLEHNDKLKERSHNLPARVKPQQPDPNTSFTQLPYS